MATKSARLSLPTTRTEWRRITRTSRLVLTVPRYLALAVVTAFTALTIFVTTLNATLVIDLVIGGALPLAGRLRILSELYPFIGTSFDTTQGAILLVVAALTGVDVALAVYHFREHGVSVREGGAGAVGVLLGVLGAGCAACGSAILFGLLALFGATSAVLLLPLEGLEFALLAIGVLVLSIHWLVEGMRGGLVNGCPID